MASLCYAIFWLGQGANFSPIKKWHKRDWQYFGLFDKLQVPFVWFEQLFINKTGARQNFGGCYVVNLLHKLKTGFPVGKNRNFQKIISDLESWSKLPTFLGRAVLIFQNSPKSSRPIRGLPASTAALFGNTSCCPKTIFYCSWYQ